VIYHEGFFGIGVNLMRSNSNPDYSKSWYKGKDLLVKIAKYLLQGLIMFVALLGFEQYIYIVIMNVAFSNYIPFMSYILLTCLFLVFILVGALNRLVTMKLWNINVSSNWVFLMGQGIVLVVLMVLTIFTFANFYVNGLSPIYGFTLVYVPLYVPFPNLGLTIPVIGFLSKILMTVGAQIDYQRFVG